MKVGEAYKYTGTNPGIIKIKSIGAEYLPGKYRILASVVSGEPNTHKKDFWFDEGSFFGNHCIKIGIDFR